ncbi:hypothetical protein U0030_01045 [Brevundimonas bullata]|uniref:hypothetical protein n=1 Tax=Brevundimonas TaxID=41275 RepID=UPI000DB7CB4F|nr:MULTISPECIES: hypothetical protein [Brevundimonas]PZT95398.1 MAG: hypothetical protein DI624_13570 [Brevundimonas sp.]WQE37086.1 hypothetical protein U0030_01045 [Brevundimonas bullata]
MFGSRGRKAIEQNSVAVLEGFHNTVEDDLGEISDRDATIMFAGWLHYSIALLVQSGQLKVGEIPAALQAGALAVRSAAPDHGLGHSYIEVAQNRIFEAMREANGSPIWPFLYHAAASEDLRVSEAAFAGALMRETEAVARMR